MKRFERSNGLDTALYKKYLLPYLSLGRGEFMFYVTEKGLYAP